jgi:hypothetical protein
MKTKLILVTSKIRLIHLQQPQQRFRQHILIDLFWLDSQIKDCFERVEKRTRFISSYPVHNRQQTSAKVRTNGGFKIGLSKTPLKLHLIQKKTSLHIKRPQKKKTNTLY